MLSCQKGNQMMVIDCSHVYDFNIPFWLFIYFCFFSPSSLLTRFSFISQWNWRIYENYCGHIGLMLGRWTFSNVLLCGAFRSAPLTVQTERASERAKRAWAQLGAEPEYGMIHLIDGLMTCTYFCAYSNSVWCGGCCCCCFYYCWSRFLYEICTSVLHVCVCVRVTKTFVTTI